MAEKGDSRLHSLHPSGITVTDLPKFDLDSYISNYDGYTRLERLLTIGTSSKPLAADALKLALAEAKEGKNVPIYIDIVHYLRNVAPVPDDPAVVPDQEWVERTRKMVDKETERLESELKGYKNNLIKESIRMGNEELGTHYHATGDLSNAHKAYTRMREYCTTPKHLAEMNLKMALVHLSQHNYIALQQAVYRIQNAQLPKAEASKLEPAISPLLGLVALSSGDYTAAAHHFLATDAAFIAPLEPIAGITLNRAILSPNDVATYGTLCALATYDRTTLRTQVLESPTFRQFLELEPHLRRAVAAFVSAKFTACIASLDAYRPDYSLDPHLQRHVAPLLGLLRRKSIVSFFAPYDRVAIPSLCSAFGGDVRAMTAELAELINAGALDARIDAVNHELLARSGAAAAGSDAARREVAEQALAAAKEHERQLKLKLWRIRMAEEGLEIKPRKGGPGASGDGRGDGMPRGMRQLMGGR